MPLISILVPCFNTEKFLQQCLDTLRNQTLKDIEIICVNDGSTDATLNILEKNRIQDPRIKIIDKKNTGYGDSMNIALDNAKGKYIGIVEPDDYVDLEMFQALYDAAEKFDLDKVRCLYHDVFKDRISIPTFDFVEKNKIFCPTQAPEIFFLPPAIWSCLYKRDLITQNNIRFLTTPGASFQDTSFAFKTNALARRMMVLNRAYHFYRQESGSNSVKNKEKVDFVRLEWEEIYKFVRKNKKSLSTLFPTMAMVQHNTYNWNYERIDEKFRLGFLFDWWKEALVHHLKGETKFKELTKYHRPIEATILFFPFLYRIAKRNKKIEILLKSAAKRIFL